LKVVSIDIETTGLDPESCQVLELAAILFDTADPNTDGPSFHTYVTHPVIVGDPFALSMHPVILRRIANGEEGYNYTQFPDLGERFFQWLASVLPECVKDDVASPNIAGKNAAGFDLQFLKKVTNFSGWVRPKHRTFDPAILYFDPKIDTVLPSIDECCKRAGLFERGSDKTNSLTSKHDAMGDARIVIQLLAAKF
jgi:DNA polymerase III epsilon subunit-like protein